MQNAEAYTYKVLPLLMHIPVVGVLLLVCCDKQMARLWHKIAPSVNKHSPTMVVTRVLLKIHLLNCYGLRWLR